MVKREDYIPRLAEKSLERKLNSSGCVVVSVKQKYENNHVCRN